MVKIFIKKC